MIKIDKSVGCLTVILVLLINITVGTLSVIDILSWFGISIPLVGSLFIGFFAGQITIPIALIGWILRLLGVF